MERITVAFGEPVDRLIASTKSVLAMKTVLKVPNYSIPHPHAKASEQRIKQRVEGNNCSVIYVVSDLPAYATARPQHPVALSNYRLLLRDVVAYVQTIFIHLTYVVGR